MRHALSTLGALTLLLPLARAQAIQPRDLGPLARVPAAPSDVQATAIHPCRVDLAWSHPRPASVRFDVQRRTGGGGFASLALVAGTSYADTSVAPATAYEYRVAAVRLGVSVPGDAVAVGTPANGAPTLSSSVQGVPNAWSGMQLSFLVTADDADGTPLALQLLDPQPGLVFQPATDATPPVASEVRWVIPNQAGGRRPLRFRAVDCAGASAELEVVVQVGGDLAATNLVTGDVTGDGVADVVAGASRADVAGVPDTGAIHVWSAGAGGAPSATLTVPGAAAGDQLTDNLGQGLELADVTGDGVLDVVAVASFADVGGVADAGALYVWKGGPGLVGARPPDATLALAQGHAQNVLGYLDATFVNDAQGLLFADIDGDGVLDLVVACDRADVGERTDVGLVSLWYGGAGLAGTLAPDAVCFVPGAAAGDRLGLFGGQGVQVEDVTGDGLPDVVAGATQAGTGDAGAVYVWAGAAGLSGATAPTATLVVPGAAAGDMLGHHAQAQAPYANQMLQLADVTGDGVADVVTGTPLADVGGVVDAGAAYVWEGGAGLAGTVAPRATLVSPTPVAQDQLTYAGVGQGINLVDTDADGVLDLVVGAGLADVGGVQNVGAWYVWRGGAALAGTPGPDATLGVVDPVAGDGLGFAGESTLAFADVTGDGHGDLILAAPSADYRLGSFTSYLDAGAVYVWSGGPALTGSVTPVAVLTTGTSVAYVGAAEHGRGVLIADLTGDGQLDVLAGSERQEAYLWEGGPALAGQPSPTATLAAEGLGAATGQGLQLADVTGDGCADLLATASGAAHNGVLLAGAIHVWAGAAGLSGTLAPTVSLGLAMPTHSDRLGESGPGYQQGVQLADVTADGCLDVVAFGRTIDHDGRTNPGALALWAGGPGLASHGDAASTLHPANARDRDYLGSLVNTPAGGGNVEHSGQGVQLVDLQGDGLLEILAGASDADIGGVADVGAAWLWRLGGAVPQASAPQEALTVPGAAPGDELGGG